MTTAAQPTPTRRRLIDTGFDLFYQHGFQAVGLDRILADVGITKTAFYKHFDSKDDLIIAVLAERDLVEVNEMLEYLRTHAGDEPGARMLAMFDMLHDMFSDPKFRGCLFMNAATEFPSPNDPIHKAAKVHAEHFAAEVLRQAKRAGARDPEALTKQLMLLFAGAISARHANGILDAADTARIAAEALLERYGVKIDAVGA